tara:strand:+ start:1147 stop:1371 length:225 start_codon:yes stop_codon:yes gene_type:complete
MAEKRGDIPFYRLLYLREALKMEMKGIRMTVGAPSTHSLIGKELGFKGDRENVLAQLENYIDAPNPTLLNREGV